MVLALIASVSAPGAALAHGTAHHREHHGDRARSTAVHHAVHQAVHQPEAHHAGKHDHRAEHAHLVHAPAGAVVVAEPPTPNGVFIGEALASHDESDGSHGHPTLDLPVRPRVELAAVLPLLVVATLIAVPEAEVAGSTLVPHAALARPDPDAAPAPRTRAPPLR